MNRFAKWWLTMSMNRWWITGICLLGLPLTVLALWLAGVPPLKPSREHSTVELERRCDALQHELDEDWRRREAVVLAPRSLDLAQAEDQSAPTHLARELKQHLRRISATARSSRLTELIQLAEATLAVSEHRFPAALEILRDLELNHGSQIDATFACRIRSLRGDALTGLGDWEAALVCYQESGEGLLLGTKVCVCLTHLVERSGRRDLADELAAALTRLGLQLDNQSWTDDAIIVYTKAIALWEKLVTEDSYSESSIQLAGTLNNCGIALQRSGAVEIAILHFDRAIAMQTQLAKCDEGGRATRQLADTLCNRGSLHFHLGDSARAFDDLNKSIAILQELAEPEGDGLVRNLVSALNNRALIQHQLDRHTAAIEDLNFAIEELRRVSSTMGRQYDLHLIVTSLLNRAAVSREIGNAKQAIEDTDLVIAMVSALTGQQGHDELLGTCYAERGAAWRDLGNLPKAIADLDRAVSRFECHLRQSPDTPLPRKLADVFEMLAAIHAVEEPHSHDAANPELR